jgi:hypothetical protein
VLFIFEQEVGDVAPGETSFLFVVFFSQKSIHFKIYAWRAWSVEKVEFAF